MTAGAAQTFFHDTRRAFEVFRISFALIIFLASAKTMVGAIEVTNWPLLVLATVEAIAAVFLLFPRFLKPAGIVLMFIFLLAITLSIFTRAVMSHLQLFVFLVCAYFITVHGPVKTSGHV